ncbi:hypothetical protein EBI_27370 [Enterocytozoon bieneusi H348]|nr:hypothetical protein EBI_27370 [Enterocytozoon bieneusi H348]|eukprot:XP_002651247.1 hypothetical protein EBI_27370 [Enterocytozoon bieneusi H348]
MQRNYPVAQIIIVVLEKININPKKINPNCHHHISVRHKRRGIHMQGFIFQTNKMKTMKT